jgi:Cu+-exporting ATPase
MARITSVVLDKTGTVTHGAHPEISIAGDLSEDELAAIKLVAGYSTHPLSNMLAENLPGRSQGTVQSFKEIPGMGIEARVEGNQFKLGSPAFVGFTGEMGDDSSRVFVAVNGEIKGFFRIKTSIRKGIRQMLSRMGDRCVALLSGDKETEKERMSKLFHPSTRLLFNQSPHDKLAFVRSLQEKGKHIMMLGDGLNDSGALKQADVGIAVTDDTGVFTPACDGILKGNRVMELDRFLHLAKAATKILKAGFVISFLYNAVALSFAVTGHLTPLVAAVLMPISSITVVSFSTLAVNIMARKKPIFDNTNHLSQASNS